MCLVCKGLKSGVGEKYARTGTVNGWNGLVIMLLFSTVAEVLYATFTHSYA